MTATKSFVFENHFHPYVGVLVEKLNQQSVDGLLDLATQAVSETFFDALYKPNNPTGPGGDPSFTVKSTPKNIDVGEAGPYSIYNWELFFHAPVTIARAPEPQPALRRGPALVPPRLRPDRDRPDGGGARPVLEVRAVPQSRVPGTCRGSTSWWRC